MSRKEDEKKLADLENEQELAVLEREQAKSEKRRSTLMQTAPVLEDTAVAAEALPPETPMDFKQTAGDAAMAFPMGATMNWADEIMNKIDPGSGDIYKQKVELARKRSPISTMASELAGTAATATGASALLAPVAPFMAEGALAREAIIGGTSALGGSEAPDTAGKVIDTAVGAGMGLGATIVGRALKAPFKDPGVARARGMGATKPHFRFMGTMKDPSKIFSELKDAGLLIRDTAVKFDPKKLSFSRTYGKGVGPKISRTNPMVGLADRAETAGNTVTDEIKALLSQDMSTQPVDQMVMGKQLSEDIQKSINESVNRETMRKMWSDEIDNLMNHFQERGTTLSELNDIKHTYQTAARKIYNNPNAADDLRTKADIHADIARNIKNFIEESVTKKDAGMGARLKKLNETGFKLHIASDILNEGAQSTAARGWTANVPLLPQLQQLFGQGLQSAKESPESILMRSAVGERMGKVPFRPQLEDMAKQYPGKEFQRGQYGEDNMALPKIIDNASNFLLPPDRAPQSLPEQLVRKPFPRTSEGIKSNREFILAKLAQQAPDYFDTVRDIIDFNPEQIPDIMPVISLAAPHMFEHDKYNRWDGIITDPHLKDMARKEIMDNDQQSNTQKANVMNRLNKTGEYR